jgi:GTP-binding protein Era
VIKGGVFPDYKSGMIAVVGRPNAGKSTLINALIGHKISIVTAKPQTTRHAILGIITEDNLQAVFVDTPGMHKVSGKLINKAMNKAAVASLEGADMILFMVDARGWTEDDTGILDRIKEARVPCILLVNKVDYVKKKDALFPYLAEVSSKYDFKEIMPVSALNKRHVQKVKDMVFAALPVGPQMFPDDMMTDRGIGFRVGEMLREKLMKSLHEEVPYGLGVEINILEDSDDQLKVDATIWVDRESHKGIVVGKGGDRLKAVGRATRLELNDIFDRRFHLQTRVKVKSNWADSAQALRQLGYDEH